MESRNIIPSEHGGVAKGVRTAALVIILGAVALMADHTFFVAPHARATVDAPPVTTAPSVSIDGFVVPESLRPTAGDVTTPLPTF